MKFKKVFGVILLLCVLLSLSGVLPVYAEDTLNAGLYCKADIIRPSEAFELTLTIDGCRALAFSGDITYSSDVLQFDGVECCADGWYVSAEPVKDTDDRIGILAFDPSLSAPVSENTPLIKLYFTVKPTAAGLNAWVELTKSSASDGKNDYRSESFGWSLPVSAEKSDDCTLHTLTVNGLIPTDFSVLSSVCHFTLSYDFTDPKIVTTCDENAVSKISGPKTLAVGENTYLITVTSQSGLSQVYTLIITRQDENGELPDANTELDSITLSTGFLSPAFSPKVYDYLVYVLESDKTLTITPHAQSSSAVCQPVTLDFHTFDFSEPIRLTVLAENGRTLTYSLTVLAVPDYNGIDIPGILTEDPAHKDPVDRVRTGSQIRHTRLSKYLEDHGITFTVLIVVSVLLFLLLIAVLVFVIVRTRLLNKAVRRKAKEDTGRKTSGPSADDNMKDF